MSDRKGGDDFVPKIVYKRKPSGDPASSGSVPNSGERTPGATVPIATAIPDHERRPTPFVDTSLPRSSEPRGPEFSALKGSKSREETRDGRRVIVPRAARRRTVGIWALAVLDTLVAVVLILTVRWLLQVRAYEIERSFDVAEQLDMALIGTLLVLWAASIAAAGFLLSALGVLSLRRGGWILAFIWAIVMTLTGVGAAYGLPAILYLTAPATKQKFAGT